VLCWGYQVRVAARLHSGCNNSPDFTKMYQVSLCAGKCLGCSLCVWRAGADGCYEWSVLESRCETFIQSSLLTVILRLQNSACDMCDLAQSAYERRVFHLRCQSASSCTG
jgi:hypothetical protein